MRGPEADLFPARTTTKHGRPKKFFYIHVVEDPSHEAPCPPRASREASIYDKREPVDGRLGSLSGAHNSPSTKFIGRN